MLHVRDIIMTFVKTLYVCDDPSQVATDIRICGTKAVCVMFMLLAHTGAVHSCASAVPLKCC